MTLPNGAAGLTPGIEFGVQFGDGSLPGLVGRTEDVVIKTLEGQIKLSKAWRYATRILYDGLEAGIPFVLALLKALLRELFGIVDNIPGVSEALALIKLVPGVNELHGILNAAIDNFDGSAQALLSVIFNGDGSAVVNFGNILDTPITAIVHNLDGTATGLVQLFLPGDGTAVFGTPLSNAITPITTLVDNLDGTAMTAGHLLQNATLVGPGNFTSTVGKIQQTIDAAANGLGQPGIDKLPADIRAGLTDLTAVLGSPTGLGTGAPTLSDLMNIPILGPIVHELRGLLPGITDNGDGTGILRDSVFDNGDGTGSLLNIPGAISSIIDTGDGIAMDILSLAHTQSTLTTNAINGAVSAIEGSPLGQIPGVKNLGNAVDKLLAGMYNGLAGGDVPPGAASYIDLIQACNITAQAAAAQAGITSAIQAQLPRFYGGSGASGNLYEESFTSGIPATFTVLAPTLLRYNNTAISADEIVSAIWTTLIDNGEVRSLFLRANLDGTAYVYGAWELIGDPGSHVASGLYLPNNPSAYMQITIAAIYPGGSTTLYQNNFPLWAYSAPAVIGYTYEIISETPVLVGPPWNRHLEYFPNYGYVPSYADGYAAQTGYQMYLGSANDVITLEAVGDTFFFDFPNAGNSITGALGPPSLESAPGDTTYNYAGVYDSAGLPSSLATWVFHDVGLSAGPAYQIVSSGTPATTGSAAWVDLGDTLEDYVEVNVGDSGMALVNIAADASNDTVDALTFLGYQIGGATTRFGRFYDYQSQHATAGRWRLKADGLETELNKGMTIFKLKYGRGAGASSTASYNNRQVSVVPL